MTVLGKVAPPLAHLNHTLSDKSIRKLPRYAQDAIDKSKSTLEQYRNEAQKCLNGNSKFTFDNDELSATVKFVERQISAVGDMLKSMMLLGSTP